MIIVSFGGGTNSKAMLIGMRNRNIIPDLILFADPGNEWPKTYKQLDEMNEWLIENNFPTITVVIYTDRNGNQLDLYNESFKHNQLPSVAYGWKSCSQKYKMYAQEQFCRKNEMVKKAWDNGEKVIRYIGYDYGEPNRRENARKYDRSDKLYSNVYVMVDDWKWDREKCKEVIIEEGLSLPGKSSCWFCPNMKKREILQLRKEEPFLFYLALRLEANAELTTIKGLGRNFNWREFIDQYESQFNLFNEIDEQIFDDDDNKEMPCGCYD